MSKKLVITKWNNQIISALFEKQNMIQVNVDPVEETSRFGNIYVGKVKNIVKNINAAFVEIDNRNMCYLSLNEVTAPIYKTTPNKQVCVGDEFLIQISKEDVKTKAPVGTTNLSFTGKYVVIVHGKSKIGISAKIDSDAERKRLKAIVDPYASMEYGIVVRTNASKAEESLIVAEIKTLIEQYQKVVTQGIYRNRFTLVYHTPRAYLCAIRDSFSKDIEEIITDDIDLFEQMKEYLNQNQKEDLDKLRFYQDNQLRLNQLYSVEHKLKKALQEKVWLDCGGTLIIQPTEALTVIDVNTGKAIGKKKDIQETFLKVNLEAAKEIAKQIRLRNLSGIIIIDFIDLVSEEAKKQLMNTLEGYLKLDPIHTSLIDMTALNLVEVTRKKVRKPLLEQIQQEGEKND